MRDGIIHIIFFSDYKILYRILFDIVTKTSKKEEKKKPDRSMQ